MEPQLGWTWLSQKERRTAEQALADLGPDGTRDELGFGAVHFAYADRFFPGTSVQHTRLRYVWFVCWSYSELQRREGGRPFAQGELDRIEDRTGHRLLKHYGHEDGHGVIGGRVLRVGRSPVVKPSAVYWNAMRSWGVVEPLAVGREAPGRSEVHARWEELTRREARPEVDAEKSRPLFADAPPEPADWRSASQPLDFDLDVRTDEAGRIRRAWLRNKDVHGRTSLLSRLAERDAGAPGSMYAATVMKLLAPDEAAAMRRARDAASLAAVARAVHTCLVQLMKDSDCDQAIQARGWVDAAVDEYGSRALDLDLAGLLLDANDTAKLRPLIDATRRWLEDGAGDLSALERVYREREEAQKPGRALLSRSGGARRDGWWPRESGPLNYRWDRVAGFLDQLAGR